MQKMLIADDDIHLRKLVMTYAQQANYQCLEAADGPQALALLRESGADIVLLDVMMPGLTGFETLAEIRKFTQLPVIMLTARSEEYDKLLGFSLGADDYVVKQFSPKELIARVGAVLKRTNDPKRNRQLVLGGLTIEPDSRVTSIEGNAIHLTPKEFDLLLLLAENACVAFTREQLLASVWGVDYYGGTRIVDTHIRTLRDHLGPYRKLIETVWGVGYKLEYRSEN